MDGIKKIIWIVGAVILLPLGFWAITGLAYQDQFFPGSALAGNDLSGETFDTAMTELGPQLNDYSKGEMVFTVDGEEIIQSSFNDLGINITPSQLLLDIYMVGRRGDFWNQIRERAGLLVFGVEPEPLSIDEERFQGFIYENLNPELPDPVRNAHLSFTGGSFDINEGSSGNGVVAEALKQSLKDRVYELSDSPIELTYENISPQVTTEDAEQMREQLLAHYFSPLTLKSPGKNYVIRGDELADQLVIENKWDSIGVRVDEDFLRSKLETVKRDMDQPMRNAELVVNEEQTEVESFSPGQVGRVFDLEENYRRVQDQILKSDREIELAVEEEHPEVALSEAGAELGIVELIAQGQSNFAGSPPNRRHNIGVGAEKFDNTIIEPGAEFSFNESLGPVNQSTGYRPELVIKGDSTIPEYGGGLCQVSTTAFRAILNSGMPVTERRNHSYRVSYYEPAGTDATIYPGVVDLKFRNTTGEHMLMSTYITGNELVFELYGTKPDYTVEIDEPEIFNITPIPDPIYIESSALSPGETRQVEIGHRGADARLVRHIYDSDGKEIRTDVFESHYVPWAPKYLRGAEEAPEIEPNEDNIPPSTTAEEEPTQETEQI